MNMTDFDNFRKLFLIVFFTCFLTLVSNLLPYPTSADEKKDDEATRPQKQSFNLSDLKQLMEVQECLKNLKNKDQDSYEARNKCMESILPLLQGKITKADADRIMRKEFSSRFRGSLDIDTLMFKQMVSTAEYSTNFYENQSVIINLLIRRFGQDKSNIKKAFDYVLKVKGMMLEGSRQGREGFLSTISTPEGQDVYQRLSAAKDDFAAKLTPPYPMLATPEEMRKWQERINNPENGKEVAKLRAKLDHLVKSEQNNSLKQNKKKRDITSDILVGKLPDKTALIEFVKIYHIDNDNPSRIRQIERELKKKVKKGEPLREDYVAFILRAGQPDNIRFVDLGDVSPIDRNIAELKKEMNSSGKDAYLHSAKALYEQIFKPIREELGDVNKIFISPDSNLSLIPFEVFQSPDGSFLIEEYTFNYLTSGRDLLVFGRNQHKNTGKIVLFGDPDFDLTPEEKLTVLVSLGQNAEEPGMDVRGSKIKKAIKYIKSELPPFENLPQTKQEIESIRELLGKEASDIYTGKSALEEVLLSVRSPAILHLATHGFFLDGRQFAGKAGGRGVGGIQKTGSRQSKRKNSSQNIETSMVRSGIALAGANHALKSNDADVLDGLVTADKILEMNLVGTDMVVLSACQTGLGNVQAGEGVFGLQRAFTGAGAKSLVVSMWSVPDEETQKFMVKFYQNMFTEKMDRCQALRQAALACMKELRQQGVANPLFWGGFIFIGNPT